MAGLFALVGGDEFSSGCEDMDRAVLNACGVSRPRLIVLPTAAAAEKPARAARDGVAHFSRLGADASALMVLGPEQANDPDLTSPVERADVIYFTGGNPAHLLSTLHGSLLLTRARDAVERGALLAGSSAGAMVMGPWMRFGGWIRALALVPQVVVLPHHERSSPEDVSRELVRAAPEGVAVLGIDAMTGCLGRGDAWMVVGRGAVTLYGGNGWRTFKAGESLTL